MKLALFRTIRRAAGASALLLAACATLPGDDARPVVTLSAVELREARLLEQVYRVRLRVQNRGGEPLEVRGVVVDIDLNGKSFAKGAGEASVIVPKYGSQVVEVEAIGGLRGILGQLSELKADRPPRFAYRIRGRLDTNGLLGRTAFDDEGEIDLPALVGP